jgi:hypothetical protein
MARFIGFASDENSATGGSTVDLLLLEAGSGEITIPPPTVFFPATGGSASAGYTDTERNDEVRGVRGSTAPTPYQAAPELTISTRLYPSVAKWLLPLALPRAGAVVGSGDQARVSSFRPALSSAIPPTVVAMLVRDEQTDLLSGLAVESLQISFAEGDPTVEATLRALYHQVIATPEPLATSPVFADEEPYAGVTLSAKTGADPGVAISCFGSASLTITNNIDDDADVRFCKGQNLIVKEVAGRYRRRQYPARHRLGAQAIEGNLNFGTVRPDMEELRLLTTADRLTLTVTGNPLGTTPQADEALQFDMPNIVLTGEGGAAELVRDGALKSSYPFGAFIDGSTGDDDLIVRFTATDEVLIP